MPKYRPQTEAYSAPSTNPPSVAPELKAAVVALQKKLQDLITNNPHHAEKAAQIIHEWLGQPTKTPK